ncbi:hypothetical protein PHISCL_07657 [Aspergillus sclerotialis]|uniref:Uncharacterized protein n=1 Tax=Aspergillus sclerotialis TaxID=2070753 RepID=A0A3A2ZBM3_9EURO|nr:hypothetical protein PHISCL_07657 [Aspergillus sclerotialis]
MASKSDAAAAQGSLSDHYLVTSHTQQQQQGTTGSYGGYSYQMMSQTQSASAQGNYGNSPYYQNTQIDPSSQFHVGAWATQESHVPIPREYSAAQQSQQYYNTYSSTPERKGGNKWKQDKKISYQMERFLAQQPKEDPWHYGIRG